MLINNLRRIFFDATEIPEAHALIVRREQLKGYTDLIPAATLGIFLITIALASLSWGGSTWPVVFAFCYTMAVGAFLQFRIWMQRRGDPELQQQNLGPGSFRQIILQAALSGMIWGAMIAFLSFSEEGVPDLFLGGIFIGLVSIGSFILTVIPKASLTFMVAMTFGYLSSQSIGGHEIFNQQLLLHIGFLLVLQRTVNWYQDGFVEQILSRIELEESGEVIGLLLHDFETHASDWLWEIDENGCLDRVSTRFAESICRPREVLEGARFNDFFDETSAERFNELTSNGRSFRNLVVQVRIGGEKRWWNVSARPRMVGNTLTGYRGVCSDVTQERAAEAKVAYMAHFDALTGVANRAHFSSELEKAIQRQTDHGEEFALHSIDLDGFKGINDVHGHLAGDELLKTVARRIQECVGENDLIGRLGGDEFVVLQRKLDTEEDAILLADFVCDALLEPVQLKSHRLLATGSIGSAIAPRDGSDSETLLKHADLALYAAKKAGRGCSRFFEPDMDEDARRRSMIEQELRQALRSNELELYFQPLIDVRTMECKGYESLLRWNRPNGEIIMPGEFIEIAEATGLIIPLGEWVIRTAIFEAATWPEHLTVAINLSPSQMTNPSLISTVVSALAEASVDPARVEFEITESVLLEETDINLKTLHTLRGLGVKIALDDFGTGFSSLNYLRAFPFDKIKIDKCFVQEMEHRDDCRAIIRAVMSLATSLNMRTTAEGVENDRQMRMLREEGCAEFQGYLFSRPIPASQLPKAVKVDKEEIADESASLVPSLQKRKAG